MKQKILTLLFAVFMIAAVFSVNTEAAETEEIPVLEQMTGFTDVSAFAAASQADAIEIVDAGYCGSPEVVWGITKEGILLIDGKGTMWDYDSYSYDIPWYNYRNNIYAVLVAGTVENIGENAFQSCKELVYVYIEEGVKKIGSGAFWECSNLEEVELASTVTTIGSGTFYGCSRLRTIELPPQLKSISANLFSQCFCLERINIPAGVTSIGSQAFQSCIRLTSIRVPDKVTEIGEFAFANCEKLTSVNIPKGVNKINRSTFYGCAFKEIEIPSSVVEICKNAFARTSLEKISIPNSVKKLDTNIFEGCAKLKEVDLPDYIGIIPESMFSNCSSLTTITIPSYVKEIGYRAFYRCSSLKTIRMPSSVDWLSLESFGNCAKLEKMYVMNKMARFNMDVFKTPGSNLTIYCHENSSAHKYAVGRNIPYEFLDMSQVTHCFGDVPEGKWFVDSVQYVFDKELMSGSGEYFNPTKNVTRAQLITTLYRLAGEPEVTDYSACKVFSDVEKGKYYTKAICWAYNNGIATGNEGKFNTTGNLTRQQMATFFFRFAEVMGYDVTESADFSSMLNAEKVSDYAIFAVEWAVGSGLISGSETKDDLGNVVYDLNPKGSTTRAQLSAILQRFCEKYEIYTQEI